MGKYILGIVVGVFGFLESAAAQNYADYSGSFSGQTGPYGGFIRGDSFQYIPPTKIDATHSFSIDLSKLNSDFPSNLAENTVFQFPEDETVYFNGVVDIIVDLGDGLTETFLSPSLQVDLRNREGVFWGASGTGGAFKIGDQIDYSPPEVWGDGAVFSVDLSGTGSDFSDLNPGTPVEVLAGTTDFSGVVSVQVSGIDPLADGSTSTTFETSNLQIDNIAPSFAAGATGTFFNAADGTENGSGIGGAFRVGDVLKYVEPDSANSPADSETFSIDATDLQIGTANSDGTFTAAANTEYEITSGSADFSGVLEITATDDAGNKVVFDSPNIIFDSQLPIFDSEIMANSEFLVPQNTENEYQKIGSILTIAPPVDANGDEIYFKTDLSDIAENAIFDESNFGIGDQNITLVAREIDTDSYQKTIEFFDDAGNKAIGFESSTSSALKIDLVAPVLDADEILLSISSGAAVAAMDETVIFSVPNDISVIPNALSFSVDLSDLGGEEAVFENKNSDAEIIVLPGNFTGEAFSQTFSVADKAGNTTTGTSNSISVYNKLPEFDTNCGGIFTLSSDEDGNNIADFSNGSADVLTFTEPNSTDCDAAFYSIDFSSISGGSNQKEKNPADGENFEITVGAGNLDNLAQTISMRIFDEYGNYADFSSGSFAIDNDLPAENEILTFSSKTKYNDFWHYEGDSIMIEKFEVTQNDIKSVSTEIPSAVEKTKLSAENDYFSGRLEVESGSLWEVFRSISYEVTDDAGNVSAFSGEQLFGIANFISSSNSSSSGGTSGLGQSTGSRSQSSRKTVREQNEKAKQERKKRADDLKFSAPKEGLEVEPKINRGKSYFDIFKEKMEQSAAEKARENAKTPEPEKLQMGIKKLKFPNMKQKNWEEIRDDSGGFRVQNTIENLKKRQKRDNPKVPGTLRKSEGALRGKVQFFQGEVDGFGVQR